jgi:hypothetical protein
MNTRSSSEYMKPQSSKAGLLKHQRKRLKSVKPVRNRSALGHKISVGCNKALISGQLLQVANSFVLRRDATLLKKHLPPKRLRLDALSISFVWLTSVNRRIRCVCNAHKASSLDVLIYPQTRAYRRPCSGTNRRIACINQPSHQDQQQPNLTESTGR